MSKNVRILILSNMYPSTDNPSFGVFVQNIEHSLKSFGLDVVVVAIRGRRASFLSKVLAYIKFYTHAFGCLLFTDRVVYIHFVAHTSLPFLLVSFFRKLKLVAHVHGGDVMSAKHRNQKVEQVKAWFSLRLLRKANFIIVPSSYFKKFVSKKYNVSNEKFFISSSGGVDTKAFSFSESIMPPAGLTLKLGYVGRLVEGKGVNTLLSACAKLPSDFSYQLKLVGSGEFESQLKAQANSLGISANCHFIGECLQTELVNIYQELDYLIFPTELNESLGLVGLEAMSCGVPILTTGIAGITEYFKDSENGIQYETASISDLCLKIQALPAVGSHKYKALCESARKTAVCFDKNLVERHLVDFFNSI